MFSFSKALKLGPLRVDGGADKRIDKRIWSVDQRELIQTLIFRVKCKFQISPVTMLLMLPAIAKILPLPMSFLCSSYLSVIVWLVALSFFFVLYLLSLITDYNYYIKWIKKLFLITLVKTLFLKKFRLGIRCQKTLNYAVFVLWQCKDKM